MTEEQKEKYGAFLNKVSEILGLNKPVDVLKLCAVTDEYIAPFQKHISELEKDCKYFSDNLDLQIEATLKLQNENAELKEQNRNYEQLIDKGSVTLAKERLKNYKQLTKAKDHIKQLLDCLKQDTNDTETNYYVCQYMDKAEQFIKDLGK